MKRLFVTALVAAVVLALAVPAGAITQGTPDGDDHPMVGMLFYEVAGDWFVCTGTAVSPTVVVTAGHCTDGASNVHVTFDETPVGLRQIMEGARRVPGNWYTATPHTHPNYDPGAFYLHDLGVVVLDKAYRTSTYGRLPHAGYLDDVWRSKTHHRTFTPVGYGVDSLVPNFEWTMSRQWATSRLIDLKGTHGLPGGAVAVFSNNSGQPHRGGTCNGDSGGPMFEQGTVLIGAIVSYGISPCVGTDGAYRIDKTDDLAWIGSFVEDRSVSRAGSGKGNPGK